MAVAISFNCHKLPPRLLNTPTCSFSNRRRRSATANARNGDPETAKGYEDDVGVRAALSVLKFYKREISPALPKSCRYVPTCSEYSMEAYKKYGFNKGTVLMVWRLCRCNPLGGSGFDPPRWFGETSLPQEEEESSL